MNLHQIILQELHQEAKARGHKPNDKHLTVTYPWFHVFSENVEVNSVREYRITIYPDSAQISIPRTGLYAGDIRSAFWNNIQIPLADPELFKKIWQYIEK